ncbi:hypothetical protein JIN77_16330 [Verrucomicrobiaceae bacterium R5-34]|nr:hypothetical protein [Verrucomicrobiaceae bacterium R5-34]
MKNYLTKTFALSTACVAFAITATTIETIQAQAPEVAQPAATASMSVAVPEGGAPVTYTVNGATVTIQPGQTGAIPPNATGVQLPAGCTISVTVTEPGQEPTTSSFSVDSAVTLDAVTPAAISANASAFAPAAAAGGSGAAATGSSSGSSGSKIQALVNAAQVLSANAVNPATISDGVSTDGN